MKCFAYGSNMSSKRLAKRVDNARPIGTFRLDGHALRFHKVSIDNSGKCDAYETGSDSDFVLGVLYEIEDSEKLRLDDAEGLGNGYAEKCVRVTGPAGRRETAVVYYATNIDESLRPYTWYKRHVLEGAREAGLDAGYVSTIETQPAVEDPCNERERKQLEIYRDS